jgi:PPOX class probable F420-dependent enzyme
MPGDHVPTDALTTIGRASYALVTTFRKDGRAVATPVWVVHDGDSLAIWTVADSGKIKRLRRSAKLLIGPCDLRGRPLGDQVPGRGVILDAAGTDRVRGLIRRKYGLAGWLTLWGSALRRGRTGTVAVRITLTWTRF